MTCVDSPALAQRQVGIDGLSVGPDDYPNYSDGSAVRGQAIQ